MEKTFVIQNHNGHYLSKQKEWVDGGDRRLLFRTPHKDEVINLIFELSSRDIELRASRVKCDTDENGNPIVTVSDIPLPEVANGDTEGGDTGEKPKARDDNGPEEEEALEMDRERTHLGY